ncbi:MAG: long-chain fatty acid--CoA ligase, partial [Desulfurococcales archaeon]|nr:long-chain fatty acid--CoA ligase [Desulfurococcales archaeon]
YKGHSVYPRYIEEILYKHECVAEVAVIGIPDPEAGENIKAVVSLKPECRGKLSEEELKEWSKQYLGAHEYPRIIEFVDELPKSPAGKILRRVVRERELEKLKNKQ